MNCANCGSTSMGSFCPICGQNNRNYQRALPLLLLDLLRETFDVDSRLLQSLKLLLFKPGELSLEFSRNRRASYVSPFRLYLFVSVMFFFIVSVATDMDLASDESILDAVVEVDTPAADRDIDALLQVVDGVRAAKITEIVSGNDHPLAKNLLLELAADLEQGRTAQNQLSLFLIGQLVDAVYAPQEVLRRLLDNLPVAAFFLLPVFAGLLSLFYFRAQRFYIENLVFATHLHTFAFIVYAVMLLLPDAAFIDSLLPLLLFAYHFTALKRYYRESAVRTFFKYTAQMTIYFLLLFPMALVLVAVFTLATV